MPSFLASGSQSASTTASKAATSNSRAVTRGYGHRVLIASLFLPDTIAFQERDESVIQTPQDQSSAPPSPSTSTPANISVAELGNRLAGVSAAFKTGLADHERNDGHAERTDSAVSDAEGPPLPPISAPANVGSSHGHGQTVKKSGTSPIPPRRGSSGANGASAGPSSAAEKKPQVKMSELMAEATRPPAIDETGPPSRRSASISHPARLGGLTALSAAEPTPSSSVADHGRGTSKDNASSTVPPLAVSKPPLQRYTTASPSSSLSRGTGSSMGTASGPHAGNTTTLSLAAPGPSSRRGSMNAGTTSPASGSTLHPPGPAKPMFEGSGTRTPGGQIAGKAGTLQPLSIIGDLQARRQQLALSTAAPTPGDAERHHPFGGGAVTPLRGSQTPGVAPRTPGAPPGAQTPGGANKGFHAALSGRSHMAGLSMTKATDSLASRRAGGPAADTSLPSNQMATKRESSSSVVASDRASSQQQTAQASASRAYNDHGRGAALPVSKDQARESPQTSEKKSGPLKKVTMQGPEDDDEYPSTGSTSPATERPSARLSRWHSSGPPLSRSSRSSSKARLSRRQSAIGSKRTRRTSADTLSTFAEDAGEDLPESGFGYLDELPPYDFVPNAASNGGLVNAISSLADQRRLRGPNGGKLFIGTPSLHSDEEWLSSRHRRSLSSRYRDERQSVPVWVKSETFRGAYANFCKGILWPTFHYTLPTDRALEGEHEAFESYRELNMAFARQIADEWREGDIVFINDYHLLLVPQMLREMVPSATIGLFIHIAFPSSELFRCLAMRETLLRGMLGADLVGFQTHNFCRHFRQTVSRILQLEATPKGVQAETFFTTVSSFPIGIDPRCLNAKRADPDVAEWVSKLTERYEGKKVIVGRDKLDWIRGVRQKLLAFEVFLNEHPEWVGKVVLIQVALATNEDNEEAGEANDVVSRINSKYSTLTYQPVVFLHVQDITFSQYLALLTVADAFMANSLREGMNLTTHEYIICQEEKQSPLILSEFTGTYSALRACIGINPWNTKQVAHAIHKALTMSEDEQRARWADLHRTVVTQTALQWITSLLSRLERAHVEQQRRDNAFIPKLEVGQIVSEWRAAKTRLILLDLEETLLPESIVFLRQADQLVFPEHLVTTLTELTEDPKNSVYIFSSLSGPYLDKIAEKVPRLGLVSEDGCSVRHPSQPGWLSLTAGMSTSWKSSVTQILRYFQDRTPGSFLNDRGSTLFFSTGSGASYKPDSRASSTPRSPQQPKGSKFTEGADDCSKVGAWCSHDTGVAHGLDNQESQWARRQLAEINNLVYDSLGLSLRIIPRGTTLTVMPKNVSRTSAVQHIVQLQAMGVLPQLVSHGHSQSGYNSGLATPSTPLRTPPLALDKDFSFGASMLAPASQTADKYGLPPRAGSTTPSPWDSWKGMSAHHWPLGLSPSPNGGAATPTAATTANAAPGAKSTPANLSNVSSPSTAAHLAASQHSQLHSSTAGNFDFALCLGRDEKIMSHVSSLDLPFAPLTVTTAADLDERGSEAGFSLAAEDVSDALHELTLFRRRDLRWGVPSSVDD
ncbi:unnamed protein product [Parajaminaea phylloscopi]